MSIAIGTYVSFQERDGTYTGNDFQNFHAGVTRAYDGRNYMYGAFGFSGAAVDGQSDAHRRARRRSAGRAGGHRFSPAGCVMHRVGFALPVCVGAAFLAAFAR